MEPEQSKDKERANEWYKKYFSNPEQLMKDRNDLICVDFKEIKFKWDRRWLDAKTKKLIFYQDYDRIPNYDLYNGWLLNKAFEGVK